MYYFAYGDNLNQRQMRQRCPRSQPLFAATLPNYTLVFAGWSRQWWGGLASIKTFRGHKVRGAIYDVSETDFQRLDSHKRSPVAYNRFKVTVYDEDNQPVEAATYVMAGQIKETPPSAEYLAVIQQGYRDWRLF